MSELPFSRENYQREVLMYRWLPTITAAILIVYFVAVALLGGNPFIAILIAAIVSLYLVWRWILAGRQIEHWGCPHCQQPFPKKTYWTYPPRVCPHCGKLVVSS